MRCHVTGMNPIRKVLAASPGRDARSNARVFSQACSRLIVTIQTAQAKRNRRGKDIERPRVELGTDDKPGVYLPRIFCWLAMISC